DPKGMRACRAPEARLSGAVPMTAPKHEPASPERLVMLVRRVAAGDEAALASLYDDTQAQVFGLARQVLADVGAAEEATLDVFTQAWREAARFDPARGGVVSWLMNMARCRAID